MANTSSPRPTFAQRVGKKPLPAVLRPEELSPKLRNSVWELIYRISQEYCGGSNYIQGSWRQVMYDVHVHHFDGRADEFNDYRNYVLAGALERAVFKGDYSQFYDLLEFMLRHEKCDRDFSVDLQKIFEANLCPYRVVDEDTIAPIGSAEEGDAIERAFNDLSADSLAPAKQQLKNAVDALNAGDFPGSVHESIGSVESVARKLAPGSKSLGDALKTLRASTHLHQALEKGFSSLYGYTSDEQGVRHPLIDSPTSKVGMAEALYMLGACAAFTSYLVSVGREAGILKA